MKNLVTKVIDQVILMVYGAANPSDEEWTSLLGTIQRQGIDRTAHLIFTYGGAPSPRQRRGLRELLDGRSVPVALIAESFGLRLGIWMLSCYDRQIAAFPPSEVREAIASLADVPASRIDFLTRELRSLREQVRDGARSAP